MDFAEKIAETPATQTPNTPFPADAPTPANDTQFLERSHFETTISVSWVSAKERRPRSTTSLNRRSWVTMARHPWDDLGIPVYPAKCSSPNHVPSADSISSFSIRTQKRETKVSNNFCMQYKRDSHVEITPGSPLVKTEVSHIPALPRSTRNHSVRTISLVNSYIKPRLSSNLPSLATTGPADQPRDPPLTVNGFLLDSLVQNALVLGPRKCNLRKFLNNLDVTHTLQELRRQDLSDLDRKHFDLLIKYLDPFPAKIHIERMANTVPALSEFLFRQQDPQLVEVFNLPLIATEPLPSLREVIQDHRSACPLLAALNPNGFVHYFAARFDDFFVDAATSTKFTDKWLELYVVPRFLVIQTLYPLTDVLTRALEYCVAAHRRTKLNSFVALVADGKTTLKDFETLDADASPLLNLEPVMALLASLESQKPLLGAPLVLPLGDRMLKTTLPGLKEAPSAEIGVALSKVLRNTCFEELLLMVGAMVAEKNVVLISTKQRKISRTLAALNAILSPMSWVYPMVYALPRECLQILAAPIPVVAGVLSEPTAFLRDFEIRVELPGTKSSPSKNTVFVYLDYGVVRACPKLVASVPVPLEIDTVRAMDRLYRDNFNPKMSKFVKLETSKSKCLAKLVPRSALSKSEASTFEGLHRPPKTPLKPDALTRANELLEMFRKIWEAYLTPGPGTSRSGDAFGDALRDSQAYACLNKEAGQRPT